LLTIVYFKISQCYKKETWEGINLKRAFNWVELKIYIKLGIPGILAMTEWWYWEIICFMMSRIGIK